MSTDIKRIFSHSHLCLPHVQNRLTAKSTCAVLCLRTWSSLGLVKDCDIQAVTKEKPAGAVGDSGEGNIEIEDGWDNLIDDSG